jgi:hypothetical protein
MDIVWVVTRRPIEPAAVEGVSRILQQWQERVDA